MYAVFVQHRQSSLRVFMTKLPPATIRSLKDYCQREGRFMQSVVDAAIKQFTSPETGGKQK